MNYQQLTENERYMLSALRKQGLNTPEIAITLAVTKAPSIAKYKKIQGKPAKYLLPQPALAHSRAVTRRSRSRLNKQFSALSFVLVDALLPLEWNPEQTFEYIN